MDFDTFKNKRISKKPESGNKSFIQAEGFSSLIPLKKGYTRRKKEKHITEFLHSLVKIKAYRDLNATGLLKLAKRYAYLNKNDNFYQKFNEKLRETYFCKSKRIDAIRNAVKKMYKQIFAKGQPEKAKTVFRRLGKGTKTFDIFYLISGVLIGVASTILIWKFDADSEDYMFTLAINSIFFACILFGLCLKAFKNFSINYKFIFNFDVASSINNSIYLLIVSSMFFLNNLMFLLNNGKSRYLSCFQISLPLIFLINPLDMFYLNSRIYLVSVYARGILLPISTIRFRHFYFVDVLQSFKYPFKLVVGHFLGDANLVKRFPLLMFSFFPIVRIFQCLKRFSVSKLPFPHIANLGKYILAVTLVYLEVFEETFTWIPDMKNFFKFITTLASFLWDVLVDWAIYRNRYMFPGLFYIFAVCANFLIRFYWIIPIITQQLFNVDIMDIMNAPYTRIIVSISEIIRRFIWTMIRVEVEHLNNCDELKFKNAISLTAGELFYKKDIEESYQANMSSIATETEFETEMEDKKEEAYRPAILASENTGTEDDSIAEGVDLAGYDRRDSAESHEDSE